ncbi:class I SAM-dependent methyltransferase [Cucumibacter marinus]|uniref:class I SAM-dependent methyltransferase n=1 Tax=Cucumibacter marinus TaxID=1121252 RepID=UPI0009DBB170|nr:class I SAM-dependent methyltransferase [Cucumibacter marinus]
MKTEDFYKHNDGKSYHSKRLVPEKSLPRIYKTRSKKFQKYIDPRDTVFEYGCGSGWNLADLQVARAIGFDISPIVERDVVRCGIEWCADSKEIPNETADVVICHHVLEHVPNPAATLEEIHRISKKDGSLLLVVPLEKGKRTRTFVRGEKNHHVYSWTVQTIGNLIEDCGYRIDTITVQAGGFDRIAAVSTNRLPESIYKFALWMLQTFGGRPEIFVKANAIE